MQMAWSVRSLVVPHSEPLSATAMNRPLSAVPCAAMLALLAACTEPVAVPDPAPSLKPLMPRFVLAEAQSIIDSTRVLAIFPAGAGQNLRQTFRPSTNQTLGYIELPVACATGVLLVVSVRDSVGTLVAQSSTAGLSGAVRGFRLLQLNSPSGTLGASIRRNELYSFELSSLPATGAAGTTCGIAPGPVGNSYARGRGFFRDPINGPAFLPLPNGAPTDQQDLAFRTFSR